MARVSFKLRYLIPYDECLPVITLIDIAYMLKKL